MAHIDNWKSQQAYIYIKEVFFLRIFYCSLYSGYKMTLTKTCLQVEIKNKLTITLSNYYAMCFAWNIYMNKHETSAVKLSWQLSFFSLICPYANGVLRHQKRRLIVFLWTNEKGGFRIGWCHSSIPLVLRPLSMRNKSGLYATHDVWTRIYGEKSNWFLKASIARPKKKKMEQAGWSRQT